MSRMEVLNRWRARVSCCPHQTVQVSSRRGTTGQTGSWTGHLTSRGNLAYSNKEINRKLVGAQDVFHLKPFRERARRCFVSNGKVGVVEGGRVCEQTYCKRWPQDSMQQNCSEYSPAPPALAPMDSPSFHRQACERQVRGTLSRNSKLETCPFVCLQIPKWAASTRA